MQIDLVIFVLSLKQYILICEVVIEYKIILYLTRNIYRVYLEKISFLKMKTLSHTLEDNDLSLTLVLKFNIIVILIHLSMDSNHITETTICDTSPTASSLTRGDFK